MRDDPQLGISRIAGSHCFRSWTRLSGQSRALVIERESTRSVICCGRRSAGEWNQRVKFKVPIERAKVCRAAAEMEPREGLAASFVHARCITDC
jgi:hypothetical protein